MAIREGIRKSGAPMVEPSAVARAITDQIVGRKSGQVIMGPGIAAAIRGLPTWIQEFIRDRMAQIVTVNATSAKDVA